MNLSKASAATVPSRSRQARRAAMMPIQIPALAPSIPGPAVERDRPDGVCPQGECHRGLAGGVVDETRRLEDREVLGQARADPPCPSPCPPDAPRPGSCIIKPQRPPRPGPESHDPEGVPPVGMASRNQPPIPEPIAPPSGKGQEVEAHDPASKPGREEVREQRRGDDPVAGLADPEQGPPEEHVVETVGEGRSDGGHAPESHAEGEQLPSAIAVAQHAHQRRDDRVDHHERHAQLAELGVAEVELLGDRGPGGEEDVAIDVVQQVHAEQDDQGEIGALDRGRSRVARCPRRSRDRYRRKT